FLERAGAARPALESIPGLESRVSALADLVRKSGLAVPPEEFLAHVGAILSSSKDAPGDLDRLHAADLCLAFACSRGDRVALGTFEREQMREVAAYVGRRRNPDLASEVQQLVRERVLTPSESGDPPRIASYTGRGPL